MSAWLFDLGNTRLKYAPLRTDGSIGEVAIAAHDGVRFTTVDWGAALPASIDAAWIASVAADAPCAALLDALAARGARVGFARTQPHFAGIAIAYAQPQRLGVDRFLAMAAAHARGLRDADRDAALVIGVGTALTVDLLDADGRHRGGRIAPSPALMREALHARAVQLPRDGGDYAEFADDTDAALASGCIGAALGLIERSARRARDLLGTAPRLWLHGGGIDALLPHLDAARHAPTLVLEGLALWAREQDTDAAGQHRGNERGM
jgi:type III pantothenate kinase